MNKLSTKTLKILLFIGVFFYLQYYDIKRSDYTINSVTAGLMMASAAYLIASLFGIVLNLTRNYLLAIIGTAALALFIAFKLDDLIASVSWLTESIMTLVLGILAIFCLLHDIIFIKRSLSEPPAQSDTKTETLPEQDEVEEAPTVSTVKAQQLYKENPEWMLELSKRLEQRRGHKPTYEELIDYIDNEACHLLKDEEIDQEVSDIVEKARAEARRKRQH